MRKSSYASTYACTFGVLLMTSIPQAAAAAEIYVPAGGDLQAALNAATGGDTVLLAPGATYTGNFKLPVHGGTGYVTVRTAPGTEPLPPAGSRITPAFASALAKLRSANNAATVRTAPGAAYWRLELLEVGPSPVALTTLVELGDGSSAQYDLSQVPHHLVLDRVYVHGDPLNGQKRGIGLNSAETTITNSYVSDIKGVGVDTQALAGWNGPGPYVIRNNYLESAGTSILFGGDDPKVPGLIPSDITFRDNAVTRPVSWRTPLLAAPQGGRVSFTSGGSLAAGTYGYRVVARRMINSTTVRSAPSAEVSVSVASGSRITIQWNAVADAADYLVYGRTVGAENRYWVVQGTSFTDDGVVSSTSGTPAGATVWQVKNLFELKNARRVQADHNLFSNNWAQAQTGTAILFTVRNQYGRCTWCVVEDVTFEHNVVQGIGGGFQITGWDNLHPSQQGNHFRIRHNLIADLSKSWGGKGYIATISDAPRDITFDHNTVISPDGSGLVFADGNPIAGFTFTNNVARHNTYGIFGSGSSIGNKSLAAYFPDSVVTRNVFAGGSASYYPAGNEFPSITQFQAHFLDYAGGNFALVPGTDWEATGTDGMDLGADVTALADAGRTPTGRTTDGPTLSTLPPLQIETSALPSATEGDRYAASLSATGGIAPYSWTIASGALPAGLGLDMPSGNIVGTAMIAGDYAFMVTAHDAAGADVSQPLSIHVNRAIAPVSIVTSSLNTATATMPFAQALEAAGGLGSYVWSLSGTLPPGVAFSPTGVLSGTTTSQGTYPVTITVADAQDATRTTSQPFSLYVAPPPNRPPAVSLSAPANASVVPVGATIALTAHAFDVDGNLSRVDFFVGATFLGSSTGPSFTVSWLVPTSGSYQLIAVASDTLGASATSAITISTTSEIILYANDATALAGNYQLVADAGAAGGTSLWNPDKGAGKVGRASAAPASYAEFAFYAEAGRPYHLWIRSRAQKDYWGNDSAYVQFSNTTDSRIGTARSETYNLEDALNAGIRGWGWQDSGWGTGVLGADVVFTTTGRQTIRIQPREDGLYIDQIVLSPQEYLTQSPGEVKNDATVLPR